jgi:hypothetical protein
MPNVESREIRGVTFKLAVLVISQCIVITAAVVATYFGVINEVRLNRQSQQDYEKYNDQRIQTMQVEQSIQGNEIKGINQNWNSFMIRYVQDHSSPLNK